MRTSSPTISTHVSRRRGFSLVELLVALTVAAIVLGFALPRFAPMRQASNVRAANQVVNAYLNTARQTAVRRGQDVTFERTGNTVRVWTLVNGAPRVVEPDVDLAESYGVTVEGSLGTVRYNSRGFAWPRLGAEQRLRVYRGKNKDSVCVSTLGMLGRCGL